ncbi:hypothetical protein S83_008535 [Arachis hypogaea]
MNSLSVWAWVFLFGHLVWATGFMFLISWRGYWQELIETLAWAHERTPLANLIRWRDKPVALSIVQARLVGLAHFSVGYIFTYAEKEGKSTRKKNHYVNEKSLQGPIPKMLGGVRKWLKYLNRRITMTIALGKFTKDGSKRVQVPEEHIFRSKYDYPDRIFLSFFLYVAYGIWFFWGYS